MTTIESQAAKPLPHPYEEPENFTADKSTASQSADDFARLDYLAFDAVMQQDVEREWNAQDRSIELSTPLERARQLVEIQTLGVFKIRIGGVPLTFGRKVQKKPLELLKALIALGGKGVREDALAECLWPDADGDAAAHALATALYRLRRLLGSPCVQRANGALTLNSYHCRVDLWLVERLFGKLATTCRAGDADGLLARIEQLFVLHQGSFLDSEHEAWWALNARDRLRTKISRFIEMAGTSLRQARRFDAAIACYEHALATDLPNEALYRGLMQCYLDDQRHSEVVEIYNRCARVLRANLGIAPSMRTEVLLQQAKQTDGRIRS